MTTAKTCSADLATLLATALDDPSNQWSIGTFGAIAEFSYDAGEAVDAPDALTRVTARGGIRLSVRDNVRPFASESVGRESWSHRVSLCLPKHAAAMAGRTSLTERGEDREALRPQDRGSILFDLGLGVPHLDVCVRVPVAMAGRLRAHLGRPVFEPGNPVMADVLAIQPHRVFVSRLGRVEVFAPIPAPDGRSPDGPHTHILPILLRHRRTHPANEAVPEGHVPCAHFYPAHPLRDGQGMARPFDEAAHARFQLLMDRFGEPEIMRLKASVWAALDSGALPATAKHPPGRFASAAVRTALRQAAAAGVGAPDCRTAWTASFDGASHRRSEDSEGELHHG